MRDQNAGGVWSWQPSAKSWHQPHPGAVAQVAAPGEEVVVVEVVVVREDRRINRP
jgi:hypothetical protein